MGIMTNYLAETPDIQEIIQRIGHKETQLITGMAGSARTLLLAAMVEKTPRPIVVVSQNLFQANQLLEDLTDLVPDDQLYLFPVDEVIHAEMAVSSPEAQAERVEALGYLLSGKPGIIITPLAGVRRLLPPKDVFEQAYLHIEIGGELDLDALSQTLVEMGYVREQRVASPGEFSIRGGIVDIYPLTEENPVRIELFDVEVDSLRYFNADTQRSIHNIEQLEIVPATDRLFPESLMNQAFPSFRKAVERAAAVMKEKDEKELLLQNMAPIQDALEKGEPADNLNWFADMVYSKPATLFDYLGEDAVVVMDEYPRILENERRLQEEEAEWATEQLAKRRILPNQTFSVDLRESMKKVNHDVLYFALFQKGMGNIRFHAIHPFQYRNMQQFFGQMHLLKTELDRWIKQQYTVVVAAADQERADKVHQTFLDFGIESIMSGETELQKGRVHILQGTVRNGFELPKEKLALLTEKELFNRVARKKARRTNLSNAERLKSYTELNVGDYVVHVNHGIGRFVGMETMEIGGVHQDYMSIVYQDEAKLFIPVTQVNLLQKYVSSEGKMPRINKLGGTEWSKTKRKVESKIEDIADELIELYAEREAEKGYGFSPDTEYQKEFEDAFPYTETEDQLRSIEEIKHDMEKEKPMDRLLVGDVGYGKTEVAMRAIFKAVQDGKQAAFLVPTTVLAQQHYDTMLERFEDFPVEIGLMSRFRTRKQQKETIDGLRKGQIDVVVGTHRLLSKDVEFQDLGLLIVDEEQRFGVKHKERLKNLKKQVDVLTLTATPIPRTLHMSMLGVRDLSVIETPPANWYPVQTYVMELNAGAVREAVEREMARGGQAFYLYNRVETIEKRVDELQQLIPDARITYAHGQMSETQLENVLLQFVQGEYDLLVTTTIIETGVDMPNVNTLFIEDADRMGLSQLYQLRGRVGRSSRVAYAYLMYQPNKVLNEISEKRLQAVKEFTELGSGFKIAMRDLSIRGAGNLLGQQQHGFIDSVGFDLYSQMLSEAVARKRGDKVEERTQVEIDLAVDAYIPSTYIGDGRQKIEIYKRVRQLRDEDQYVELQDDLFDRFGDYPQEVADLLAIGLLKMHSERALVETIKRDGQTITVTFSASGTNSLPLPEVFKAMKDIPLKTDMNPDGDQLTVSFKLNKGMESYQWLEWVTQFVKNVAEYRQAQQEEQAVKADAEE